MSYDPLAGADALVPNNSSTAPRSLRSLLKDYISFDGNDIDLSETSTNAAANTTKLQAIINEAQATNKKIWCRAQQGFAVTNAPLTFDLGRTSGVRKDLFFDGNALTIIPKFVGYAMVGHSVCSTANRNTGDNVARFSLQSLTFDNTYYDAATIRTPASGATPAIYAGAKSLYLGGGGKSLRPFDYLDALQDILVKSGRDTHTIMIDGEVGHLIFRGVVARSTNGGGLVQQVTVAGDVQSDFNLYSCEFGGNSAAPPMTVFVSETTGMSAAQIAGIHHYSTVFYGMGTIVSANTYGTVRDVWFANCQVDNSGTVTGETNVSALTIQTAGAGPASINDIHISDNYIEGGSPTTGFTGSALRIQRNNAMNAMREIRVTNLHAWGIDRGAGAAGIIDLYGAQDVYVDSAEFVNCNAPTGAYLWADQTAAGIPSSNIRFTNNKSGAGSFGTVAYKAVFINGVVDFRARDNEGLVATNDITEVSPGSSNPKDVSGWAVSLQKTASQTLNATSATLVTWSGTNFDRLSRFVSASNAIRATKAGTMRVKWKLAHTNGVTVSDVYVFQIFKNGAAVPGGSLTYTILAAQAGTVGDTIMVPVAVNDLIDLRCTRVSGTGGFIVAADASALTNMLEGEQIA